MNRGRPLCKCCAVVLAFILVPSMTLSQVSHPDSSVAQTQEPDTQGQQAAEAASCADSKIKGEADAKARHSGTGWMVGGFFSGVGLGLIGTGIITAVAASTNPQPKTTPEAVDETCYISGYSGKAGSKNTWSAFGGGLLGTAVIVAILLSASSE